MVYKATKAIAEALEAKGIKYSVNELSKSSNVKVGVSGKNVSHFDIRFISSDDDNDVSVRVYSLVKVPEAKLETMLEKLNEMNDQYRYARFHVDSDNEVTVSFDMALCVDNVGDIAFELVARLMKIVDDSYPDLMKIIWS